MKRHLRVGIAGLGLDTYWSQFAGLEQRLTGYLSELQQQITIASRTVINLGKVDTPQKSLLTGHRVGRRNKNDPAP